MEGLLQVEWREMFSSQVPPLELFVRGSLIYLGILAMFRLLLRREAASITVSDLLMVVLIADAGQNAMAKDYHTLTDGAVLIGTIIFWNYTLDRLAFRFRWVEWFVHPPPLPLIRNGRVIARNLRRESISEQELMSQLRENGVEDIADVKLAVMEGDGRVSVIRRGR